MFHNSLQRLFIGKDARDLDQLIFDSVEVNVKSQGVPLCVQIANIQLLCRHVGRLPVNRRVR